MEAIVMFSIIGAIAVVIGIAVYRAAARRREACRTVANQMSLVFRPVFPELIADLSDAGLLPRGNSHGAQNALAGTRGSLRVALADLSYMTGSGSSRQSHTESICVLRRQGLDLTRFAVQGRSPLFSAVAGTDVTFADDPEVSRSFLLQGEDEVATKLLFGPTVRTHLSQLTDRPARMEGGGEMLMLSHRLLVPPTELRALLTQSTELLELFSTAQTGR